jgi:hypothetical protein
MNFEIVGEPLNIMDYYQEDHNALVRDILNKKYIGWVFIKNEDSSMNGIYHVTEYQDNVKNIELKFDHAGPSAKLDNLNDVTVKDYHVNHFNLLQRDIIYKLEELQETQGPAKIRWYKKGKLRTYEQFKNI